MPKTNLSIHYIWCGPPPSLDKFKGHDTIGADLLSQKYPNESIHYWCLAEHVCHYKTHFKAQNIEVHSIDDFLDDHSDVCPELPVFFAKLKQCAQQHHETKDKAREYTTLKVLTQLYLQQFYSGYFLDSNIIPNPDYDGDIQTFSEFTYPKFTSPKINRADPWLMFSPKNDKNAVSRLEYYLNEAINEFTSREKHNKINRQRLGEVFVETVERGEEKNIIPVEKAKNIQDVVICQAFLKRYYNTHRSIPNYIPPPIASNVIESEPASYDELKYILEATQTDSSAPFKWGDYSKGLHTTSLLHDAILSYEYTALMIVLPYASQLNIKIPMKALDNKEYTPMELAIHTAHEDSDNEIMIDMLLQTVSQNLFQKDHQLFFKTLNGLIGLIDPNSSILIEVNPTDISSSYQALSTKLCEKEGKKIYALAIDWIMSNGPVTTDTINLYTGLLNSKEVKMTEEKVDTLKRLYQSSITSSSMPDLPFK